jgi:hypothetical protein
VKVAVTTVTTVPNFDLFSEAKIKAAVAAASGIDVSKVAIKSIVYKVSLDITFTDTVTTAQAATAVASSNSVAESTVTVTAAATRRLTGWERKLGTAKYNVEIIASNAAAAQAVKDTADDTTALLASLTAAGVSVAASDLAATEPVGTVTVETEVEVPAGTDTATVSSALKSDLAAAITTQIPGSSTAPPTVTVTTPSPTVTGTTAAPAPAPPGATDGASFSGRQVAKVLLSVFAVVAILQ